MKDVRLVSRSDKTRISRLERKLAYQDIHSSDLNRILELEVQYGINTKTMAVKSNKDRIFILERAAAIEPVVEDEE